MCNQPQLSQNGFSVIEALIGFIIFAIGFITLASIQTNLMYHSDLAKQKTEAIRFAQNELENFKSFSQINGGSNSWSSLSSTSSPIIINSYTTSSQTASTNTTFSIQRNIESDINKTFRLVSAIVNWPDRKGTLQSVTLASIISKSNPVDSAYINLPLPQNTFLKRPKSRNINIPIQAADLGDGNSAFQLRGNYAIIFNDASGYIIKKCNTLITTLAQTNDLTKCSNYSAYLLAGYVTYDATDSTLRQSQIGMNTADLSDWDNTGGKLISCIYQQARNQNTGTILPRIYYYICVIPALADKGWSGRVRIGGIPIGPNKYYTVCRHEYRTETGSNYNQRNVQPYSNVNESIDNQNYFISTAQLVRCPTNPDPPPILHQDCWNIASGLVANTDMTGPEGRCPSASYNTLP
jgi:hypothetical protein